MEPIINEFESAVNTTVTLLSKLNHEELNSVPFKRSWTAAQAADHLIKAGTGMDKLLAAPAPAATRRPDEKAKEFRDLFLDFTTKMQSPDFILPDKDAYEKEWLIKNLEEVKNTTVSAAKKASLNEVPQLQEGHPLQGTTKLELLYFMAYHTQRHNRQIENITAKVKG